jgi:SnoaL-like protein
MSTLSQFLAYAAAFEKAFVSDDWSLVEPFFTEDAVYEVGLPGTFGGRIEGRPAILAYFKRVLDAFDRRFATRAIAVLEGPRVEGNSLWARGRVDYTTPAAPDLSFELEEIVTYQGDRICRLEDRYDDGARETLAKYIDAHRAVLDIPSLE